MPIAWRTDYAMRIMYETACLGEGGQANVGQLAERAGVPYDFARQIANKLTHEGLLMSRRGSKGGFLLARSAHEITMLDIFLAMGEKPTMSLCTHVDGLCSRSEVCPIHHAVWSPLDDLIERQLASESLADAVARGNRLQVSLARSAN
ncbi:MAG TPA: Rrf2 family transcriptional regulator [Coriobacteriia bacterium]|nr:Rrf2 family transcriptional regulator [Coriobacteriia bacterium]